MREISGFGSGYEKMCRTMVSQGCKWWSKNPVAKPKVRGFEGIFGLAQTDNKDAELLEKAMLAGNEDCTGAMHQASMMHIFHWKKLGSWAAYQREMRKPPKIII
jgi:hypothetical protein